MSYHLYVDFSGTRSGGEAHDPSDRWTSYEPVYYDEHPTRISVEGRGGWMVPAIEEFQVGESVLLVYQKYSDGDTFSTSHGVINALAVVRTDDEAREILAACRARLEEGGFSGVELGPEWDESYITVQGTGYFDHHEDFFIEPMVVQP